MELLVRSPSQRLRVLTIDEDATVLDLKQYVEELDHVGIDYQTATLEGRSLIDTQLLCAVARHGDYVDVRLCIFGGKGGFGSLLRASGRVSMETEATAKFSACRTLDGRRVRHVEGEKKIKDWIENGKKPAPLDKNNSTYMQRKRKREREEREKHEQELAEKQKAQMMSLEKFANISKSTTSAIDDAVQDAVQRSTVDVSLLKRRGEALREPSAKRTRLWNGAAADDDDDDDDSSDEDGDDDDGGDGVTRGGGGDDESDDEARVPVAAAAGSSSPDTGDAGSPSGPRAATAAAAFAADADAAWTTTTSSSTTTTTATAATAAPAARASHATTTTTTTTTTATATAVAAPATSPSPSPPAVAPTAATAPAAPAVAKRAPPAAAAESFAPLVLCEFASIEDLMALGDAHLRAELTRLGLKAGGTPQQRADRLFSIRVLDRSQWPKKLFAPVQKK